jgi:acyl-CoA hydrolase
VGGGPVRTEAAIQEATKQDRMSAADFVALSAEVKHSARSAGSPRGVVNPMIGTWRAGWREIGGTRIFARSKAEANYARFLQWQQDRQLIRSWAHEKTTFWFEQIRRGVRSYLIDFDVELLSGSFEYHEVKGYMDARSKTKLRRMAKYHPDVVVKLIDQKAIATITRQVGRLIPGWE